LIRYKLVLSIPLLTPAEQYIVLKQKAQLSLRKANRTVYVRSPASEYQSWRESNLSEVKQFHARYVNGTLSRKLQ